MHKSKRHNMGLWFTLVELIVVIVILAILATIAFLSFSNQSSAARDSTRMADMSNIAKWLWVNHTIWWNYALPDKNVKIFTTTGTLIWYQWEAGSSTLNVIKFSSDGGKDPLDETYYTYTTNKPQNKYQLLAFLENNNNLSFNYNPFDRIEKVSWFEYSSRYPYEKWDGMWIILSNSIWTWSSSWATVYTPIQDIAALQASSTGFVISDPTINTWMVAIKNNTASVPVTISSLIEFTTPLNPVPETWNVSYKWTKTFGWPWNDSWLAITTDSAWNIYVVWSYQSTVDFNPEAWVDSKLGWWVGTFISKYGPEWNYIKTKAILWQNTYWYSVATDSSDNVYVTWYFNWTVDFWWGDNKTSQLWTDWDIFITKINSDWSYGWTKTFWWSGWDSGNSLAIDKDNNIYITWNFRWTSNFNTDGWTDSKTSSGWTNSDVFITKINSNGSYWWTKTIWSTNEDSWNWLSTDATGNIFVTWNFKWTVNFNTDGWSDIKTSNSATFSDVFITKINSNGSYWWTKTIWWASDDVWKKLKADSSGNIFVTWNFKWTVNFNTDGWSDIKTSNWSSEDVFIMKISASWNYLWTKTIWWSSVDNSYGIGTDTGGNVMVTWYYKGPLNFNTDGWSDIRESNLWSSDIFLIKINSNWSYWWTKTIWTASSDNWYWIATTPNNDIFLVWYYMWTANFDTDGWSDIRTSNWSGSDIFFTKFK
ncbi:MAG: hypothetical protein ACD_3C00179G0006 [uncultured bacterium (gcode 4)]|uniref:GH16 domain-containing protein n=1 Tax=uncultured bacterium (gcode 4) TaxID=1234023 RepID=K2FXJ2_9BACT|nr:MAG: hypothetical protein ACD_3C00179G0006 [uncultured bacterium (gcode 4)]